MKMFAAAQANASMHDMEAVYREMLQADIEPDIRIFNCLLKHCTHNRNRAQAKQYLRESQAQGKSAPHFSLSTMAMLSQPESSLFLLHSDNCKLRAPSI